MARDIDIVNMSLGSSVPSQAVEQKLEECVLDGVACIVAAGNSGDAVQYPASSPHVLAVSAVGRLREFPSEAWDTQTIQPSWVTRDGLFSPSFTCFGPQIAVCAPGVAIVSTVPNAGFEPESGTSMAAPHVTGLAALLLAHHPIFQSGQQQRGPQRVAALFNAIRAVCAPYPASPERFGAGMPSLHPVIDAMRQSAPTVDLSPRQPGRASVPPSAPSPQPAAPPAAAAAAATASGAVPAQNVAPPGITGEQLQALLQQLLGQALINQGNMINAQLLAAAAAAPPLPRAAHANTQFPADRWYWAR